MNDQSGNQTRIDNALVLPCKLTKVATFCGLHNNLITCTIDVFAILLVCIILNKS